ncbi:carboxypeptidase Y inhibitor [Elasticomyces elasticus]|nr:carboxypeptidase Y inhibitor [Elasticomyces elasticus]KAK3662888.1 carboxypeptidase Y inhibitor [Elasticomyces elasticus]KAK4930083.1 carboxypeptidase Y inhibitor [Elasticomyces elasticus]KAK5763535.1 carboxypeptidase Y inhibitor [Elasticomyces elasticus]
MALRYLLCSFAVLVASSAVQDGVLQHPLDSVDPLGKGNDAAEHLLYELRKAEIIPTVLDVFDPKITLSIFYENATVEVGNTVDPSKTQKAPDVHFIASAPNDLSTRVKKGMQLTLALTDPDAPSRDNPEWSEICHWIATGVQLTKPSDDDDSTGFSKGVQTIVEYKPPGPPPKTGKHRYVFVALAPKNGTTEKLSLSKPGGRQHWGYGKERQGLRRWAEENGLVTVGANFIYEQNEKQ